MLSQSNMELKSLTNMAILSSEKLTLEIGWFTFANFRYVISNEILLSSAYQQHGYRKLSFQAAFI